jgi:hypothetical protein
MVKHYLPMSKVLDTFSRRDSTTMEGGSCRTEVLSGKTDYNLATPCPLGDPQKDLGCSTLLSLAVTLLAFLSNCCL